MKKTIVEKLKEQIKQLEQDNEDMRSSTCTHFHRCSKCKRLHDSGYCCFYCGNDDSRNV